MWARLWNNGLRTGMCAGAMVLLCGCVSQSGSSSRPPEPMASSTIPVPLGDVINTKEPLSPERTEELVHQVGENWLYGQGMGETALNVGTAVVFPPYLVYLVGNAALGLSGYEQITPSSILPDQPKEAWRKAYGSVTQTPGRVAAAAAGREFRTQEVIKSDFKALLKDSTKQTGDK